MIEKYSNLRGNSPIESYEIETDRITIWFKKGKPYSYSYATAGVLKVEAMKQLARQGARLSAFITKNARYLYE